MSDIEREKQILHELIKARKAVKRKYDLLKFEKDSSERVVSETFKPITEPLEKLVEQKKKKKRKEYDKNFLKKEENSNNYFENSSNDSFHTTGDLQIKNSIEDFSDYDDEDMHSTLKQDNSISSENLLNSTVIEKANEFNPSDDWDKVYGLKKENGHLVLGNVNIQFDNNFITVNNKKFPRTPGLEDLIIKRKAENYTSKDKHAYKQILIESGAHLTKENKIKRHSTSWKYKGAFSCATRNLRPKPATEKVTK